MTPMTIEFFQPTSFPFIRIYVIKKVKGFLTAFFLYHSRMPVLSVQWFVKALLPTGEFLSPPSKRFH
jgi:hypothetical protein